MTTDPTTLRESLEAAIGQDDTTETATPAPAPASEAAAPDSPPSAEAPGQGAPEPAQVDLNKVAEQQGQARDEQGKFKQAAPAQPDITPGPKAAPKTDKAPASWRPDVRSHWSTLPEPVRAEVARREQEVQRTLQETAEARRYIDQVNKAFAPYEAYIRAEGANPLQVIDNLMGTAVRLRTATGPELAQLMAGMVQQFGTGRFGGNFIGMLDSALAGVAPQQDSGTAQIQQAIQQQLAPVQQFMSQFQQAQVAAQQRVQHQAQSEVEAFLSSADYGQDVREEMADLMEMAARRGRELTLQQAYEQACQMNPAVRSAMAGRQQVASMQGQTNAAQRARAAAVSVPGAGPAIGAPKVTPDDTRSAIEAAIAMHAR